MWPRQILELGKQFNLMIRLQNILKASLQDLLKISWKRLENVLKTSWRRFCRRLEDVLKTSWQDVLQMSWRRFRKTSWRRLLKTNDYGEYIRLDQDIFKTSSEDEETSSRRLHQDECLLGNYFYKTLHLSCSAGFCILLWTKSPLPSTFQDRYFWINIFDSN